MRQIIDLRATANHDILREPGSIIVLSFTYKASFYVFRIFSSSKQDDSSVVFRSLFWFYKNEYKAQSNCIQESRPNVSTLQSSAFIRGDLKSQRYIFLYTQEVKFATKVEILLWQTTTVISLQSMNIHINMPRF